MVVKERHEGLKEQIGDGEFCGMLKKLGQYRQAYKDRWFVLQGDKLWYFKTQDQARAITFIPLRDAVIRDSNDRRRSAFGAALPNFNASSKVLTFEIITRERVFELVAPSAQDKKEWLGVLLQQTKLQLENDKIDAAEALIQQHELSLAERMEALLVFEPDAPSGGDASAGTSAAAVGYDEAEADFERKMLDKGAKEASVELEGVEGVVAAELAERRLRNAEGGRGGAEEADGAARHRETEPGSPGVSQIGSDGLAMHDVLVFDSA